MGQISVLRRHFKRFHLWLKTGECFASVVLHFSYLAICPVCPEVMICSYGEISLTFIWALLSRLSCNLELNPPLDSKTDWFSTHDAPQLYSIAINYEITFKNIEFMSAVKNFFFSLQIPVDQLQFYCHLLNNSSKKTEAILIFPIHPFVKERKMPLRVELPT